MEKQERIDAAKDVLSLWGVQLFLIILVAILFRAGKYWLMEGPNHDSLIYFEGINWALHNALQVNKETVREAWGLGACGDGGSLYIGHNCSLYRAGSYTLAAFSQFFNFSKTGTGLWLSSSFAGIFIWLGIRFIANNNLINIRDHSRIILFIVILASISTGWIGSFVNSNLATTFAASCIALMFSLIFAKKFRYKPIVVGMLIGLSGHLYSEAIFYTGFLALFVLLSDSFVNKQKPGKKVKVFAQDSLVVLIVLLLAGNFTIFQSLRAILFISGNVSTDQPWASWYIHGPTWYWLGSFVSGDLPGWQMSNKRVVLASICVIFLSFLVSIKNNKIAISALVILSILLVLIIEIKGYQYGEHKILQLIGPSWYIFISASLLSIMTKFREDASGDGIVSRLAPINHKSLSAWLVIALLTIYVSADYLKRSNRMLKSMEPYHTILLEDQNIASQIAPGNFVALDDSAFTAASEPYLKSHYAIFFIHSKGARIFMPDISENTLRGGYYRNQINNTFKNAEHIDFVLQGKGANIQHAVFKYDDNEIISYPSYDVIRVRHKNVALMGSGWYQCEPTHCWTNDSFNVETFIQNDAAMILEMEYISAPDDGLINIYIDDIFYGSFASQGKFIRIKLGLGYHKVNIKSGWNILSPKEIGISEDNRKLFAMVKSIRFSKPTTD